MRPRKKTNTATINVVNEFPKVVLDRSVVINYLRNQNQNNRLNTETVLLLDSSDEDDEKSVEFVCETKDADNSVEFVSETKPPEITPKTERDQLRRQNMELKHQKRKLEIHIQALQNHVINSQPYVPIENVSAENLPNENALVEDLPNEDAVAEILPVITAEPHVPIENALVVNVPNENAVAEILSVQNEMDMVGVEHNLNFDDSWVLHEISVIQKDGDLSLLANEIAEKFGNE